ncbi:hypothetical protein OAF64_02405 [Crocinitomicaceae bacterium]|jgi:hypothetical protein|nr:hypothetical protein [Crocinitomicaceae bacterium]
MQQNFKNLFPNLPGSSRVWTYLCNRALSSKEVNEVQLELNIFTKSWKAHQKQLSASANIIYDQYVVFAVDESAAEITGCSIDASVHFMKTLQEKISADFFNRMNVLVRVGSANKLISYNDLENYRGESVFNPRIERLEQLRENWLVKITNAPFF